MITTFKICYFKFNSLFQILKIRYNDFFKFVITNLIRYNGFWNSLSQIFFFKFVITDSEIRYNEFPNYFLIGPKWASVLWRCLGVINPYNGKYPARVETWRRTNVRVWCDELATPVVCTWANSLKRYLMPIVLDRVSEFQKIRKKNSMFSDRSSIREPFKNLP